MRISHEAIYQALYVQGRGALRRELTPGDLLGAPVLGAAELVLHVVPQRRLLDQLGRLGPAGPPIGFGLRDGRPVPRGLATAGVAPKLPADRGRGPAARRSSGG